MSKFFYAKLATVNIKKNARIYAPYILTCIFTVAMFYIMLYITFNKGLAQMQGAQALSTIMGLGSIVIGIFSVIILLYTNSFLMKRRKKELGLYNILGMGKNHIARVLALEVLYVALLAIAVGLFVGILLSKIMLMLLLKLLTFSIPFGFEVSPIAIVITAILFAVIFFITLLFNVGRVHLSKPIELLYGGNVGEKEPKTKWLLTVIGALALGAGYTIAIIKDQPLQALGWFFIAVLLVILGTYFLFTAGSIAFLKALRNNKGYYYKTKHFASISGMIYRMKQNAVGLANICILSTMVLVILSTTVALYLGAEDAIRIHFPRNIEILATDVDESDCSTLLSTANQTLLNSDVVVKNAIDYRYKSFSMKNAQNMFSFSNGEIGTDATDTAVFFLPLDEYNKIQGTSVTLKDNELMVYSSNAYYGESTASFGEITYSVHSKLDALNVVGKYNLSLFDTIYFIVPDDRAIENIYTSMTDGDGDWQGLSYYYGFDTDVSGDAQVALTNALNSALSPLFNDNSNKFVYVTSVEGSMNEFLSVYGGFFFLGLFLGVLFIMATVIIMYYKQISEGYDDKKRFEIMQKVGLGHDEIKKTIRSQVLTVFFLPLLAAAIHILAAFKMITKLLLLFSLTNVQLFAVCTLGTIIVFAVIYAIVYALTARTYYKIVS